MANRTLIVGDDGANALQGGAGAELIYGFDPNGPQGTVGAIAATRVAAGLDQPLFATAAPDDFGRLFVVEKSGRIKIVDLATGATLPAPFLDLSGEVETSGEQGLLGLAFHPGYATNGFLYVYLSTPGAPGGDSEVRRYQVSPGDPNRAEPSTQQLVTRIDYPATTTNHRAGWIGFGPDGKLFVALGDGAADATTAQRLDTPLGKILRLDVDADAFPGDPTRNYAVPADNPAAISGIAGAASATGIYAAGLRNPFRDSFDRGLGDFFIGDVGSASFEEINRGQAGANYGWPATEGFFDQAAFPAFTQPIHAYPHGPGASVTGGYVYRGQSEGLQGQYFFADFIKGQVSTLRFTGGSAVATERTGQIAPNAGAIGNPSSFGEDALGNLYLVDFDGEVFRLTPQAASADQGDDLRGGGGDDMIFGGSGADRAFGEAGRDVLYGGLGDDVLDGGEGGDTMAGGPGDDVYVVDDGADLVHEAAGEGTDTVVSMLSSYTLRPNFENVQLAGGALAAAGNGADNVMIGNALGNTLAGGGGGDYLDGGAGDDLLFGGEGADTVLGNDGDDYLDGGAGDDLIMGGTGNDTVLGADGNDYVNGGGGDDLVFGGAGIDILLGELGGDYLNGEDGNDIVFGGEGTDTVIGGLGDDYLDGGTGDDILTGGDGNDTLFASSGDDYLQGDAGNDVFVFEGTFGKSLVIDLSTGAGSGDIVQFKGGVFADFADVQAHAVQDGTNVVITATTGDTLTLANVVLASLVADDFRFG